MDVRLAAARRRETAGVALRRQLCRGISLFPWSVRAALPAAVVAWVAVRLPALLLDGLLQLLLRHGSLLAHPRLLAAPMPGTETVARAALDVSVPAGLFHAPGGVSARTRRRDGNRGAYR